MYKIIFLFLSASLLYPIETNKNVFSKHKSNKFVENETRVEAKIKNNVLNLTIEKDGEVNTYNVDLKDIVELNAIHDLIGDLNLDFQLDSIFDNNHTSTLNEMAFLGVHCEDISDQLREYFNVKSDRGVLISEIVEESPAEKANLKAGDVIIAINDEDIWDAFNLTQTIQTFDPEEKVTVKIVRKGRVKKINVILGKRKQAYHFGFDEDFGLSKGKNKFSKLRNEYLYGKFDYDDDFNIFDDQLEKDLEILKKEMKLLKEELKSLKDKSK